MKPDTCKLKYRIVYVKNDGRDIWCPDGYDGYYIIQERVRGLFRYKWQTIWFDTKGGSTEFRIADEETARRLLERYKKPKEKVVYQE